MKRAFLPLALIVATLAPFVAPAVASAESVMVLGVRSVEGDDEFTRNLTGAVRHAASLVEGWEVSDREVTFVQMALVHDCDNPNPTCLNSIASALGVDLMIYGDVRRTAAGDEFDFSINLHLFNATSGTIEHSVADTIPGVHTDIDDLRDPARRWMRSLQGAPRTGTLVVRVNVPGAAVEIDGSPVGTVDGNGALRFEDVESGMRQVRVTAEGHTAFSSSVSIEAYAEATLEGELQVGSDGGGGGLPVDLVVGSALLVAAAAFAGVWIYSGVTVFGHMNSDEWSNIRDGYDPSTSNLCQSSAPRSDRTNEICNEVATLEVLQFVFMGLTAVAGGLGLYFVISGASGDDSASDAATLELLPSFGVDHAYLGARIRY
ncbi:MAG: PEGA domain-containing protein [Myxococcales bacterium]|nr:PEGA domain-containing protein [Myxococcales bacterium]